VVGDGLLSRQSALQDVNLAEIQVRKATRNAPSNGGASQWVDDLDRELGVFALIA